MVWYSHLFKDFPQFVVMHTKVLAVNEAEWSKWFTDLQLFKLYQEDKNTESGFRIARAASCSQSSAQVD